MAIIYLIFPQISRCIFSKINLTILFDMKTLLLLAAIIGLTIGTPIGNTCAYITDTGLKIYNQAICGTADTEKLLCVLGTCLGTLKNNMCGSSAVCSIGFYAHPTFKICAPCPTNCGVCTDGSTCTDCYDYYFVNDAKTCTAGPSNCYDPVSATECKSGGCDPGFFLNTNTPPTCSAGPTNCNVPSSATVCTTCKSTFYWNTTTSACTSAGTNCLTADSDTACTTCANNYWLDIWSTTGKTVCSGPVANCDYIRKPGYCTACNDGYYLSQDTLISTTCKKITITGCKTSTTSTSVCTTCATNYMLWKECKTKLSNCKVAASEGACGTCDEGYAVDTTTKLCVFCGIGIKQCSSAAGVVSGQSGCRTGWYSSSTYSTCVYCGTGASTCTSKTSSSTIYNIGVAKCDTGYVKTSAGTCVTCYSRTTIGSAEAYVSCSFGSSSSIASSTCASNAYTSGVGCVLCGANIAVCTSASSITSCDSGYYISGSTCTGCPTKAYGTSTCSVTGSTETINSCVSGVDGSANYYYESTAKACYACSTGAKTCSIKSGAVTITCGAGYAASTISGNKKCVACASTLTGISTCTLTSGTDAVSALTCLSGYIASGTTACVSCSSATTGYTGNVANAATCTISGTTLTLATCAAGFGKYGTTNCVSCTSSSNTGYDAHAAVCTASGATTVAITECADGYCLDSKSGATSPCYAATGVKTGLCTTSDESAFTITGCAADYAYRSSQSTPATACVSATGCAAGGCTTSDGTTITYTTCKTGYASSATTVACATCSSLTSATNKLQWTACAYSGSSVVATACASGYGPSAASGSADCYSCSNVVSGKANAVLCTSAGYLVDDDAACATGYVRSQDLTACNPISASSPYNAYKDLTCSSGYVVNTNTGLCVACTVASGAVAPTSCTFVAASSTFSSYVCGTGTYKNTAGDCISCGSYASSCTFSGSTVTITGCKTGYVLKLYNSVYSCEPCSASANVVANCEYYTISTCTDGYYLDSTTNACTACSGTGVATCTSTGAVASCSTGYTLSGTTCKSCNTGSSPYIYVDKCTFDSTGVPNSITSCQPGYYKGLTASTDTVQTCITCKSGSGTADALIATCTYNSASLSYPTITSCVAGSFLGTNCFGAPSYCTTPISPGTCSSSGCNTGYYYKDGGCITCGAGASGCTYSSTSGTATITGCTTGYYFDTTAKTCSQPAVGCTTWTNSTYCSAAATGYYLKDGSPNSCGTGATACSYASNTVTISACAETYYLSSATPATCEACPTGCKACSSTGTCSSCIGGYFLVGTTCYAATDYCATANQVATCAGCTVNYYWNTTKSSCESCAISSCVHCSAYGVCSVCATGYYLSSGACVACPTSTLGSCVSCSSATTCDQCASGYYWDSTSKACKACATGCNFCAEAATCYECADNYYKNSSNLCSKCNTGCKVCSDSVNCTTCADGYVKVSSTCSACYSACKTCSGTAQNNCLTCPTNSTATSQTISGVTGNSCVCNSGYSWDSTQLKCLAGTGSASYVFVGLLSLLAILFALL